MDQVRLKAEAGQFTQTVTLICSEVFIWFTHQKFY